MTHETSKHSELRELSLSTRKQNCRPTTKTGIDDIKIVKGFYNVNLFILSSLKEISEKPSRDKSRAGKIKFDGREEHGRRTSSAESKEEITKNLKARRDLRRRTSYCRSLIVSSMCHAYFKEFLKWRGNMKETKWRKNLFSSPQPSLRSQMRKK